MKLLAVNAVDEPGPAEHRLLALAGHLRERGWAVTLTSPEEGPLSAAGFDWQRLDVGGIAHGEGARAVAAWPRALRLAQRFDVVYLGSTVCGRLLPALRGTRSVLHVHDPVDRVPRHWHTANVVLAPSRAVAQCLDGLSAHVVHGPVELDPPPTTAPWKRDGSPVIGFVGRVEPRTGVLDLMAAAPAIRAVLPDARLVIVGDAPWGAFPRYLAALRTAAEVEYLPWRDDAPALVGHLDVLVAPSLQETPGTVLAQALAAGTPVVATTLADPADVVADGVSGRIVASEDPRGLADAVLEVLGRREEMSRAARREAQRFGLDAYARRVERLITPAPLRTPRAVTAQPESS